MEDVTPYGEKDSAAARANELRELAAKLGLSQRATAQALEVDDRTLRYWFSAQYAAPVMAIYAMRYLADNQDKEIIAPPPLQRPPSRDPKERTIALEHLHKLVNEIESGCSDPINVEIARIMRKSKTDPTAAPVPTNTYVTTVTYEFKGIDRMRAGVAHADQRATNALAGPVREERNVLSSTAGPAKEVMNVFATQRETVEHANALAKMHPPLVGNALLKKEQPVENALARRPGVRDEKPGKKGNR